MSTALQTQKPFELTAPQPQATEAQQRMDLIKMAMQSDGTPQERAALVKELVELHQSMTRFDWEGQERQAKIDFDNALNACQQQIGRVAPNANRENGIKWADYAQLDRVLRPIYSGARFSIGFSEESVTDGQLRMKATLCRGGQSRDYYAEISIAPTNSKMNTVDAKAAASSRVKRYLMLQIFNIAIGIDQDEKKPHEGGEMDENAVRDHLAAIDGAGSHDELQKVYFAARDAASAVKDVRATEAFANAKNKRLGQLNRANGGNK